MDGTGGGAHAPTTSHLSFDLEEGWTNVDQRMLNREKKNNLFLGGGVERGELLLSEISIRGRKTKRD